MAIATQYKPTVAWRSIANKVVNVQRQTDSVLGLYKLEVEPIDTNDIGAGLLETNFYLMDFFGNSYLIVFVDGLEIIVEDSFRFGKNPTSGKNCIIYKSVGEGLAPYLAPIFYLFLHKTALHNSRRMELDILWKHVGEPGDGLSSSVDIVGEIPSGNIDGINTDFVLFNEPIVNSVRVYLNGQRVYNIDDYSVSGATISFSIPPYEEDVIRVDYRYIVDGVRFIYNEIPSGVVNGINANFFILHDAVFVSVYLNGQRLTEDVDYTWADNLIIFINPPVDSNIVVDYGYNA